MKTLIYLSENSENQEMENILEYLKENNLTTNLDIVKSAQFFDDYYHEILEGAVQAYNRVVVYNLRYFSSLARTLDVLQKLTAKGIEVHFSKYQYVFNSELHIYNFTHFIDRAVNDLSIVHSLTKWPSYYKKPGRPKGSKNKTLMLDRFKKEINQYIDQGFSYSTISNLIKCHPQTLKSWLHSQDQENKDIETV